MMPMFLQRSNGTVLATILLTLLSGAPKLRYQLSAFSQTACVLGFKLRANGYELRSYHR